MPVTIHRMFSTGGVSFPVAIGIVRAVCAQGEGVPMRAIRFVLPSALALVAAVPVAGAQLVNVGVTITSEIAPGVYGQVVLGNGPPPPVVYVQPVLAAPVVVAEPVQPIYLHVPPGHAKHWRKHCHEYNACDRPVYFVRSAEYEPGFRMDRWREEHEHGHGHHGEHGDHRHGDEDRDHGHGHHDD